jgi:hyperosmotically inducible protein
MKILQLIGAGVVAALFAVAACNRIDTSDNARRAAADARQAAARAGDQLADSWLTTKIQAQYFADEDIKARFINVTSDDGVVTLKGRVDNENAHEQAVQIAKNTDGVRRVDDQLIVGPAATARGVTEQNNPEWITTRIQARYFADPVISTRAISVTATSGVVSLSGNVASDREKQQAVAIARGVEGVTQVNDLLIVQPGSEAVATTGSTTAASNELARRLDDARVTSSIQAKFFLDNNIKGRRIDVATRQGVVTLRGDVASDNERAQALLLARTTEGVDRVEDNLTVNAALGQSAQAPSAAPAAQQPATGPAAGAAEGSAPQDATLTRAIESKMSGDRQARSAMVTVTAKDGVVLLEGTAPSMAVKQRIIALARQTKGVLQVVDRIKVGRAR